jgi:polysaccharide export outer membrane protein
MLIVRTRFLLLAFAFSCLTAGADAQAPAQGRSNAAVPAVSASHVLAADELIEVKVFQEPDLDVATRIPQDGRITIPLIGQITIVGLTVQQATQLIRDRLEARFLVNPQVTLSVMEEAKRLFTVLGQVQRPGTYRFPERQALDLVQVIGIAGGYTRIADPGKITVKRRTSGEEMVLRVDGTRMARDQKSRPFAVEAGDLITVGERLF